tara:strand:- start:2268 stop:3104 length:837 start_codon:yes stop_codon:yes gene_type:complete
MSEKIMCIGEPFNWEHSSCSDMVPNKFRWTRDATETDTVVCIDSGIVGMFDSEEIPENRFGWLCESPVVAREAYSLIHENYDVLLDYYKAIFTCDKSLADKHDRIHLIQSGSNKPWVTSATHLYDKTKNVSIVASHKKVFPGQILRHDFVDKHKGSELDVFGSITGTRLGSDLFDKLEGYKDYRFTIVIENCQHDNYFTEKITDAFATGTIPVYWGTSNIGDYFNTDGIIELTDNFDLNTLTPELYEEKFQAVQDNFERVISLKMADDELYENIQTYC